MKLKDLLNEIDDTIKDDLKRSRGKHLKDIVRARSRRRNPIEDETPGPYAGTGINDGQGMEAPSMDGGFAGGEF